MRRSRSVLLLVLLLAGEFACRPATRRANAGEEKTVSHTEFTERLENFFEHQPLRAGQPGRFNIHLTDLSEGSPLGDAEVTLTARGDNGDEVASSKARPGRVPGIYVADVTLPSKGLYTLQFRVRTADLDERMTVHGVGVE